MRTTILEESKITETIEKLPKGSFSILDFMQKLQGAVSRGLEKAGGKIRSIW